MTNRKVHFLRIFGKRIGLEFSTYCNRNSRPLNISTNMKRTTCLVCQKQVEKEYYESTGYRKNTQPKYPWPKEKK